MKNILFCLLIPVVITVSACHSPPPKPSGIDISGENAEFDKKEDEQNPEFLLPPPHLELPVSRFTEIWAYLVSGREEALNPDSPISDLCYFGADVDSYGKLIDIPNYRNISHFRGRTHFVAICSGRALTHFVLAEGSRERKELIRDILDAAKPYNGLQIDFEYVPARDGNAFLSFLGELRAGLGSKIFSVALPARTRSLKDDVYDYIKIKPLVDRIFVMAYDEHWSTSEPGPIASMAWCQRVASHAFETIGQDKLIMGLPFYGRSWGSFTANKAYLHSGIEELMREQKISEINRENGIPTFRYEQPMSITVFYEDDYSLSARLQMYQKMGVNAVGFWRLGQETPAFWPLIAFSIN